MAHKAIDFGWRWNNVHDFLDRTDLCTPDGRPVTIKQDMYARFVIQIGDKTYETAENVHAASILNRNEVGVES